MAPKGSKAGPNTPKLHQTTLNPLKKRSFRPINPRNGYFRHSRTMDTLLKPFGDLLQHLSTLREPLLFQKVTPKGHWKGQNRPCRPFCRLRYSDRWAAGPLGQIGIPPPGSQRCRAESAKKKITFFFAEGEMYIFGCISIRKWPFLGSCCGENRFFL